MISEHFFSRLDEIFRRLDEIVHDPGHTETLETIDPPGRHAVETASADTGTTIHHNPINQGSETMERGDTEILFFEHYPRPQRQNDIDHRELDEASSSEERELLEVAVLGEN